MIFHHIYSFYDLIRCFLYKFLFKKHFLIFGKKASAKYFLYTVDCSTFHRNTTEMSSGSWISLRLIPLPVEIQKAAPCAPEASANCLRRLRMDNRSFKKPKKEKKREYD